MPDVVQVLGILVALTVALTVHEFSHAAMAFVLGDFTAQRAGRLSLNPVRHLDPLGSLLLLFVVFSGSPGIGWGKPVPVNPWNLRGQRRGMALVSAAGPISNVLVAVIVSSISLLVTAYEINLPQWLSEMFRLMVSVNISLAAFNFLPLPPLDGFALAIGVLPQRAAATFASIESFGPGILLLLIFAPSIIRVDLLDLILQPFIAVVAALVGLGVTLVAYFLVV